MPPTPLTHFPQTLKQAKKAYRKSGAHVRLSASELAVIERRAVLQERADRIKERELRRKANLKRKEERIQKEREARHRMGIPSPVKEGGIRVGPSQLCLGDLMKLGVKRKTEDRVSEELKLGLNEQVKLGDQIESPTSMGPPLSSQAWSGNSTSQKNTQIATTNAIPRNLQMPVPKEVRASPKLSSPPQCAPLQPRSANIGTPQRLVAPKVQQNPRKTSQVQPMGPPPPRTFKQAPNPPSIARQKPPLHIPPQKLEIAIEESWDDFFVSNTQISRELSPPPAKSASIPAQPPPALKAQPKDPDTTDLLALISTQDLDFSGELTQFVAPKLPQSDREEASEGDEEFPDDELEDIVLEFELESSAMQPTPSFPTSPVSTQEDTHSFGDNHGKGRNNPSPFNHPQISTNILHNAGVIPTTLLSPIESANMINLPQNRHPHCHYYTYKSHREQKMEDERACAEAKLAAESEAFEFSTQDLRELGS